MLVSSPDDVLIAADPEVGEQPRADQVERCAEEGESATFGVVAKSTHASVGRVSAASRAAGRPRRPGPAGTGWSARAPRRAGAGSKVWNLTASAPDRAASVDELVGEGLVTVVVDARLGDHREPAGWRKGGVFVVHDVVLPMRCRSRAGTPTTNAFSGTSRVTTAPAPMTACAPTLTPGRIRSPRADEGARADAWPRRASTAAGATWAPSPRVTSCSTTAAVLMMTPRPTRAPGPTWAWWITTEESPSVTTGETVEVRAEAENSRAGGTRSSTSSRRRLSPIVTMMRRSCSRPTQSPRRRSRGRRRTTPGSRRPRRRPARQPRPARGPRWRRGRRPPVRSRGSTRGRLRTTRPESRVWPVAGAASVRDPVRGGGDPARSRPGCRAAAGRPARSRPRRTPSGSAPAPSGRPRGHPRRRPRRG